MTSPSPFSKLWTIFRPHKWTMMFGIVLAIVSTLSSILLVTTAGWFITAMGLAGIAGLTINYFTPSAIIRACAIVRTGGKYLERLVTHNATLKALANLRLWLYDRLESKSPLELRRSFRSGDLLSRIKNDVDTLDGFYLSLIIPISVSIAIFILVIGITLAYSKPLALLIGLLMTISIVVIPALCFKFSKDAEDKQVTETGAAQANLTADLQAIRELTLLSRTENAKQIWHSHIQNINTHQNKIDNSLTLAQNAITLCSNLAIICALLVLLPQLENGTIKLVSLVMITMLSWVSFDELGKLPLAIQSLPKFGRAASRIFEFDVPQQQETIKTTKPENNFDLTYNNISFSYDKQTPVLENLSLSIRTGEKIGITGPTGAGKSTILNLLLGFATPNDGTIMLNGTDTRTISSKDLLAHFSIVEQRPHIFDRTIEDNLLIARPDASREDIDRACALSGLTSYIETLTDGYKTYVGENGLNLSGGELKRLALARAFLKDAPCLILDEAGEGLDLEMEQDMMNRVYDYTKNKCLITITHRPHIAEQMDKIIKLERKTA